MSEQADMQVDVPAEGLANVTEESVPPVAPAAEDVAMEQVVDAPQSIPDVDANKGPSVETHEVDATAETNKIAGDAMEVDPEPSVPSGPVEDVIIEEATAVIVATEEDAVIGPNHVEITTTTTTTTTEIEVVPAPALPIASEPEAGIIPEPVVPELPAETSANGIETDAQEEPSALEQLVASQPPVQDDPSHQALVSQSRAGSATVPVQVRAQPIPENRVARTGYIFDHLMMLHCAEGYTPTADTVVDSGNGHPEEPMRIKRIFQRLADQQLIKRMKRLPFSQVTMEQILLVHSLDHWNKVQGTELLTDQYIQESKAYYDQLSLYVCRETAQCARLSCGGVIHACRSVCQGEVRNAFAIVRPPGHHAEPDEHMGFCFFNNVAVAAKDVQKEGLAKKVLILDWDVHHGNGTQRAFWDDPSVLYISLHRHDGGKFYPTSDFGALDMVGTGAGEGTSVNIPWPSGGFGDGDYIYAFQKIVMPIAYEFNPDLVIISAGFDAAEGDSLGQCNVTPPAYGHMTHMLCALAGGKVVVALEGGYNLEAISRSSLAVAQVLLGETPAELGPLEASEVATEVVHQVAKVQSKYWKSIDVKACEPPEVTSTVDDSPVIPIPDLLKIHRAHHMFTKHQLFQIPLASTELEDTFGGQVICSEGVYEAGKQSVLVVFVHDFGNLRVETDGVSTTNVHLTNSYLLDTSDKIVDWVTKSGYNLIDVNVLAQLPTKQMSSGAKVATNRGPKLEGQLMKYIWDNYVELSEAENVVFIGHGTGCGALMELINSRDVDRKVKAVVQVAGMHSLVRIDNDNESRRAWFRASNRIYVPNAHPLLEEERVKRRLGGQVFTSEKAKVVDVLVDVLPQIQDFVASKLPIPAPASPVVPTGNNNHANGHTSPSANQPGSTTGVSPAPAVTA